MRKETVFDGEPNWVIDLCGKVDLYVQDFGRVTVANHTGNNFLNAKSVSDGRDPQGGLSTDLL